MKIKIAFALILLSSFALWAQEPTVVERGKYYIFTWSTDAEVKSVPSQLTMNHLNGDVLIRGYHNNTIKYVEKMQIEASSRREAEKLWEQYHLKFEADHNGFIVNQEGKRNLSFGSHSIRVDYIADVPEMTSIAVNTLGGNIDVSELQGAIELVSAGGDIRIEKTRGRIFTKTYGGDVQAFQLEGKIEARSAGGDIEMRLVTGEISVETAGGDILLKTMNGNLDITTLGGDIELADVKGQKVRLKTMGGDVQVDDCEADLYAETKGGEIKVRNITGSVEGKTSGGDVYGRNINGPARLSTMSGDVEIMRITGAVDAETKNGSILISKYYSPKFENHKIFASTQNGSISLDLPANADVSFDLTARGYDNSITSDFNIDIKKIDSRLVKASGRLEKGTHAVELYVDNGNIKIRKRGQ